MEIRTVLHNRQKSLEQRKKYRPLEMQGEEKSLWLHIWMLLICQLCLIPVQISGTADLFRQFQIWSNVLLLYKNCTIGPYGSHPVYLPLNKPFLFILTHVYFNQLNFTHVRATCFGLYLGQPRACGRSYVGRYNTGRFIILSVITNTYNNNNCSQLQENWKSFFWQLEMFDVCTTGDTAHIDTIFMF
jgi:hypothetical protein